MNVLFDMVHPADAHFFKVCIRALLQRQDAVLITSRKKDITLELLNAFDLPHVTISDKGEGRAGLFFELVRRDVELWKIARTFEPDIIVNNNSPCGSHVARVLGCPSLVFDDTEIHTFNRYLYYPFVTEVHSPQCYRFRIGRKQHFYPGYHALAYLHPHHFQPDPDVLLGIGLHPDRPMILVRFVEWAAMHDLGQQSLNTAKKLALIRSLTQYGRVLISSESPLMEELEPYRLHLPIQHIHHLLPYVKIIIGDSASMSSEAVVLGTPAVYCDALGRGYTDEQEKKYGLCHNFHTDDTEAMMAKIFELLALEHPRAAFAEAHARLLNDNIDVAAYQLQQIDRLVGAHTQRKEKAYGFGDGRDSHV